MAIRDGEAVGTGRIVGDGAILYCFQDIVVSPQYQRQGIGTRITDKLFEYLKENAPKKALIGL